MLAALILVVSAVVVLVLILLAIVVVAIRQEPRDVDEPRGTEPYCRHGPAAARGLPA
jgi:heme/copper-type cytochrome/quinol oxidase subunit 2